MKKTKQTGRVISVDFRGVEGSNNLPNDNYKVKVVEVTEEEGDKAPYLKFKLEVIEGKFKGKTIIHICSMSKQSLWNLRATLEALGQKVSESVMQVDTRKLEGLIMGISTEMETYKGKARSKVTDVFSLSEMADDQDDEDEKPKKKQAESEEEDDTEEEDDDSGTSEEEEDEDKAEDDMDLENTSLKDLLELAKENEIKIPKEDKLNKKKVIAAIQAFING